MPSICGEKISSGLTHKLCIRQNHDNRSLKVSAILCGNSISTDIQTGNWVTSTLRYSQTYSVGRTTSYVPG